MSRIINIHEAKTYPLLWAPIGVVCIDVSRQQRIDHERDVTGLIDDLLERNTLAVSSLVRSAIR
jgi:hypothetical protein